jgi:hypothetical protein
MTIKQQLKEANEDKEHLSEMCQKLLNQIIKLNKKIKSLSKQEKKR